MARLPFDGAFPADVLTRAEAAARTSGRSLASVLLSDPAVSRPEVVAIMERFYRSRFVEYSDAVPRPSDTLLPKELNEWCRRRHLVPIGVDGDRVVVAMADPRNLAVRDDYQRLVMQRKDPIVCVATAEDVIRFIDRFLGPLPARPILDDAE